MDNQQINPVFSAILSRKSSRQYKNEPMDNATLTLILRAGMAAPSARNLQPWQFVAINERKLLDFLADGLEYGKMLYQAPAALVVCGDLTVKSDYWQQDCGAVTQNILLAAESLGFGSVWLGVYPRPERVAFVRTALHIPENLIPMNVIALGKTGNDEPAKDKFKPERIHWNKYQ